ncbi:MAG: protein tyrosine phosphatase family protein [Luminiphilus sp.]
MTKALLTILLLFPIMPSMAEASRDDAPLSLVNEIQYSPNLTTAGQPSEEQFQALAEAGFQQVIFLAFNDHKNALRNEDRIARSAGLEFVHIPVAWDAPTSDDFDTFAAVMRATEKTLVHCEVNFRASVFGFLYQVIYLGTPAEEAWGLLTRIWMPNEIWETFVVSELAEKGIEHPGV